MLRVRNPIYPAIIVCEPRSIRIVRVVTLVACIVVSIACALLTLSK